MGARTFWTAATLLTIGPLLFVLGRELWQAPFPISETVSVLQTAGVASDAAGASHSLTDPVLLEFLDPHIRSWYRPFYWLTWYVFWHATHSVDDTLLLFAILQTATPVLIVIAFIWHLRPRSLIEYAAATTAVAVLIGLPAFRDNLELPLLMTLVGILAAMLVWILLERPHRRWHDAVLVLLTVIAIGYKEQGLVLVPVIVMAWWVGAPGVRRGAVIAIVAVTVLYLGVRFSTTSRWQPFEQDVSIGVTTYAAADAATRFADTRLLVYAYSAAATAGNVLFSEPSDGVFRVVKAWQDDNMRPWQYVNLATSTATTALILWWARHTWRRRHEDAASTEWRLVVGLTFAMAASAALGFNYARDRLGGMAVVFYALAAYYALRAISVRANDPRWAKAAALSLLLVAGGWHLRAVGTVDMVSSDSRKAYREWVALSEIERREHAAQPVWLQIFDAMEEQGLRPVPGRRDSYIRFADRWMGPR